MNCKIIFQKRRIILALTDYFKESRELNCVARMTLYEGTKCWVVTDVRLSAYRVPSPYTFGADSGNHVRSLQKHDELGTEFLQDKFVRIC